jgi:hypothetical protein
MDDEKVSRTALAFYDRTLPKSEWTHHAHLCVGLWTVWQFGPAEALNRLRAGIRIYNEATGVANTATTGYHETITGFYTWLISRFLAAADRRLTLDELADELIRRYGDNNLPFLHWSKGRLMSPEARLSWVEPDVVPLEQTQHR